MNFSRPGAIDLSALKQSAARPAPAATGGAGSYVVDIDERSFQTAALEASMSYVVVLGLWSARAPQSADFNDTLGAVVNSYGGQIVLARVDVDANPQIAQALGVQGVPYVAGLVKGQPVPLFQGTVEETEMRRFFDELVKIAAENGVTGRAQPVGGAPAEDQEAEEPEDPRFAAAEEAFMASDFDTAVAEYEKLRVQYPADVEVAERLARVKWLSRTKGADLQAARAAAAADPDDLQAQMLVADLDISGGHVEDAFARLLDLVRRTSGDERETVRERLLELFTVVGIADPVVMTARRSLATALF
ncbi:tetratricopeptide repeat protein [Aeromicrobium wangtongii]|uniref:Tetratricopeptide repeat protein n=1 Tax=Aeromicrobium wangtongii TaxID=2969247 RepID=A0ABY5M6I3_9ACTN|nr:tetratricopeptide repeat protein [Aeromicrobium wangtongii]MCD9199206.1 tetratricopeptide repeat protein [Aeromicrobium wangtongii]UUP12766.1 tetratricopeptide repeat protein [Aeromicrobium wangtongii]